MFACRCVGLSRNSPCQNLRSFFGVHLPTPRKPLMANSSGAAAYEAQGSEETLKNSHEIYQFTNLQTCKFGLKAAVRWRGGKRSKCCMQRQRNRLLDVECCLRSRNTL